VSITALNPQCAALLDAGPRRVRNAGIDAVRVGTTFLVVLHHTAITYGAIGGWYYKEVPTDGSLSSMLLVVFCTFNQAWFMGLFFLLAGYYTPPSLGTKGSLNYLRDRLQRLGIPLLAYGFVIGPATIALAQTARGKPFSDTLQRLLGHAEFEKGPMWFAWALLIFALGAMLWRAFRTRRAEPNAGRAFPTNSALLVAALATGAVAFALRLQWPVGKEVWGLQLGYFASYVVLFVAGCLAASARWLERLPDVQVRTWRRVAWIALPVLPIVVLLGSGLLGIPGQPEGGWSIPAPVYALWEPFVAWGVILVLLQCCERRFRELGRVGTRLVRRAFAIYVIHPPVVVAVTLAWRGVAVPTLIKFALSGSVACVLCYLLAGLLLQVPGVRRVL
jgi:surface polysaccharide O-acyltransferase-like enzyme